MSRAKSISPLTPAALALRPARQGHLTVVATLCCAFIVASSASAAPVITELAWMGASDAGDEWIEFYNPGPDTFDLADYVLVEGTTDRTLPTVSMAPGDVVVIEKNATAISNQDNPIVAIGLNNGGEVLRVCPTGQTMDLASCDIANSGGGWFAGDNGTDATMVRIDASASGDDAANWMDHAGPASAALDSASAPINGSPGVYADAPVNDAGVEPEPSMDGGMEPEPTADAGMEPEPPVDAGPDGGPPDEPSPRPYITEVCWMGAGSSSDEFVELYNPSLMPILHLSEFVLNEGATPHSLPDVMVPAGGFIVLERSATATSLEEPLAVIVPFSSGLRNDGEPLSICRVTDASDCDTANTDTSWAAGDNDDKTTMVRIHYALPGGFTSSWRDFSGTPSAVTDSTGVGFLGSPGEGTFNLPTGPDGGPVGTDGGGFMLPDAGPNTAPSISLSAPEGSVSGTSVEVVYSAVDDDPGDFVEVSLYYDLDGMGGDGVVIERGLPLGTNVSYTWDTTLVPAGTYSVFGRVADYRGKSATAYAPGTVTIGNNTDGANIIVTEPDGVNDEIVDGFLTVRWEAVLPTVTGGVVSLFYDTDDSGEDGVAIATGLPLIGDTATYEWDTRGLEPGSYFIYATVDWTGGQETAYSDSSVSVSDENCGCTQTDQSGPGGSSPLPSVSLVAILAASVYLRRRRRR